MNPKKRQKLRLAALCVALSLSIGSYLTLRVLETHTVNVASQEMMAEELEGGNTLPDVHLLKQLMHKTLEFMLFSPRI